MNLPASICLVATIILATSGPAPAQTEGSVGALAEQIFNEQIAPLERLEALDQLRRVDIDAYVEALAKLARSEDERFAQHATEQLVSLIIMVGGHDMDEAPPGAPRHDMSLVEKVVQILRGQVDHPSQKVRGVALSYLVARGDDAALAALQQRETNGTISMEEALSYYIAGRSEQTLSKVREYAETAPPEVARDAISSLAADTSQQSYVRDRILRDETVEPAKRGVALEGLAKYDESFATYAADPEIVRFALEVDQLPGSPGTSGAEIVAESLRQSIEANPGLQDFIGNQLNETAETYRLQGQTDKLLILEQSILQKIQ